MMKKRDLKSSKKAEKAGCKEKYKYAPCPRCKRVCLWDRDGELCVCGPQPQRSIPVGISSAWIKEEPNEAECTCICHVKYCSRCINKHEQDIPTGWEERFEDTWGVWVTQDINGLTGQHIFYYPKKEDIKSFIRQELSRQRDDFNKQLKGLEREILEEHNWSSYARVLSKEELLAIAEYKEAKIKAIKQLFKKARGKVDGD